MADPVHIQATSRDIGGDEDVERAVLELADRPLSHGLRDVAVDRRRGIAAGSQLLGQRLGLVLRPDEHDDAVELFDLEDAGESVDLLRIGDDQITLLDIGGGRRLRLDHDLLRIMQVLLGQPADLRRDRR